MITNVWVGLATDIATSTLVRFLSPESPRSNDLSQSRSLAQSVGNDTNSPLALPIIMNVLYEPRGPGNPLSLAGVSILDGDDVDCDAWLTQFCCSPLCHLATYVGPAVGDQDHHVLCAFSRTWTSRERLATGTLQCLLCSQTSISKIFSITFVLNE